MHKKLKIDCQSTSSRRLSHGSGKYVGHSKGILAILVLYHVVQPLLSTSDDDTLLWCSGLDGSELRVSECPVLMLRPRAWNMTEYNVLVSGRVCPAPLVDFGLLMWHNCHALHAKGAGPFFYLSKLEGAAEAGLWRQIFLWSEAELGLPRGTVKACVLIENVLATFEMEEILWELREHSAGLNCGVWDYSASFVSKFGARPEFMLPDRSKYVNMSKVSSLHFVGKTLLPSMTVVPLLLQTPAGGHSSGPGRPGHRRHGGQHRDRDREGGGRHQGQEAGDRGRGGRFPHL